MKERQPRDKQLPRVLVLPEAPSSASRAKLTSVLADTIHPDWQNVLIRTTPNPNGGHDSENL